MMNKKGSIMDLFIVTAVIIIIVVFFGAMIYGVGIVDTTLSEIPTTTSGTIDVNISDAGRRTFGNLVDGFDVLKLIAFTMIFAMILSILISNFLIKAHPFFYGLYVLIVIVGVVFAVQVSNAYENFLSGNVLGPTLNEFTATNFIITNLPLVIAVVGIFGAIFLFINFPRDADIMGGLR